MAKEFVVTDESTLIGLALAGTFDLLRELFGEVVVSTMVRDEVLAGRGRSGFLELTGAIEDGWIRVVPVEPFAASESNLDVGEARTLTLAIQHSGPTLVRMDVRWSYVSRPLIGRVKAYRFRCACAAERKYSVSRRYDLAAMLPWPMLMCAAYH